MATQNITMEASALPQTSDKSDNCHSNGNNILHFNGESGLTCMDHDVDNLTNERLMEVTFSEPVYHCPRCQDSHFASLAKMALHYEDYHPGNDRELQLLRPVENVTSDKMVAIRRPPSTAKTKSPPAAMGRVPTSEGHPTLPLSFSTVVTKEQPLLTSTERSSSSERHSLISNNSGPGETDRPPLAIDIPSKERQLEQVNVEQHQTRVQVNQSLRKRKMNDPTENRLKQGNKMLPLQSKAVSQIHLAPPSSVRQPTHTETETGTTVIHQTVISGDQYHIVGDLTKIKGNQTNNATTQASHTVLELAGEDIANSCIPQMEYPPVEYNDLRFHICENLTDKQFRWMKFLLEKEQQKMGGIPADILNSIGTKKDLLDHMQMFNYLSSDNTWFLQYLLYHVGNRLLYKKVFEFMVNRLISVKALHVFEPSKVQGARNATAKLKVTCDIHQFKPIDLEVIRTALAQQCISDIEYVCLIGAEEGCIILYFQVPSESKQHLALITQDFIHDWCVQNAVLQVWFDDERVLPFQLEPKEPNKYAKIAEVILDVLKKDVDGITDKLSTVYKPAAKIGGKSLLHLAAEVDSQDMVKLLISTGSRVNETDEVKATALHMAVFLDHQQVCEKLLKYKDINVNAVDKHGNSPLHLAIHQGNFILCALLMDHGAMTDIKNQEGQTAIDVAISGNYTHLLYLLKNKEIEHWTVPVNEHTLLCPICHCSFKKPRILPCGHNFCENCLETQLQASNVKQSLECSMCKQKAYIPDRGDIREFPINEPLDMQVVEARLAQKWEKQKAQVSNDTQSIEMDPKDENEEMVVDVITDETSEGAQEAKVSDDIPNIEMDPKDENEEMVMNVITEATSKEAQEAKQSEVCDTENGEQSPVEDIEFKQQTKVNVTRVTLHSLICPACQNRFTKPVRMLACSHKFCEVCLKSLIQEEEAAQNSCITCLVCQEETLVPQGDVTKLLCDINLHSQVDDANQYNKVNQSEIVTDIDEAREDWNLADRESQEATEQQQKTDKQNRSEDTVASSLQAGRRSQDSSGNLDMPVQVFETVPSQYQQILHNAAEELLHQHEQQHKQQNQTFRQPFQPYKMQEQVTYTSSGSQEGHMHDINPQYWLNSMLATGGEDMEFRANVVEESSSDHRGMEFYQQDQDQLSGAELLTTLESPSFLQQLGEDLSSALVLSLGQLDLQFQSGMSDESTVWDTIGADITSFLSSHSSEEEQRVSLGTVLDVLGITSEAGGKTEPSTLTSQIVPNLTPQQADQKVTDDMVLSNRVMWAPPQEAQAFISQQDNIAIGNLPLASSSTASAAPIPHPKLPEYHVMLVRGYYRTQEVFRSSVETAYGCVLFYGQPQQSPEEDLTNVTLVQFPEVPKSIPEKNTQYTQKVLDVLQKGVRIRCENGYIYATRRCRSKVFICTSQDMKGDSKELTRDQETMVFNPFLFEKRFREWLLRQTDDVQIPRPPNIVIIFAQRWNWTSHHPLMNCLVYAVVTPMRARTQLSWGPGSNEAVESLNCDYNSSMLQILSQSQPSMDTGSEKQHKLGSSIYSDNAPSQLYEDQLEVALPAIEGRNTMIIMPTGAGKTVVAASIIERVINDADDKAKCIVIFVVPKGPLVKHLEEMLEQRLRPKRNFNIIGVKGDTMKIPLKNVLEGHNVVVLTAAILLTALQEGDHRVKFESLALLVFDECHHCMKDHVYNGIMKRYMHEKFEYPNNMLPQIVGLTAKTGTGKAKSQVAAEDHVFQLCANLDVQHISVVEINQNTLQERINVPEQVNPICVEGRAEDPFKDEVCKIMIEIEDIMKECPAASTLPQLQSIPRDKKSMAYMQWLSRIGKESSEYVGDGYQLRIMRTCLEHLQDYHIALGINAEVRTKDAYDYLNNTYKAMSDPDTMEAFNDTDFDLLRKFMGKRRTFGEVSNNPKYHNPLLKTLEDIIVREFQQRPNSRALLLCQTVEATRALKTWIEETDSIRFLQPNRYVGAKGMTSAQHKEILDRFKEGKHKLLVATTVLEEGIDVAECNLVIRLNYVPSDTCHVCVKGRDCAKNSKSYLIASSDCNYAAWELANKARFDMSKRAVDSLRSMSSAEFNTLIIARQKEDYNMYKRKEQAAGTVRPIHSGEFQLLCGRCRKYACSSLDIGVYNSSHIVHCEEFLMERAKISPHPKPKKIDHEFSKIGEVHCKYCNNNWGILAIICQKTLPIIKISGFIIEREDENGDKLSYIKDKWIDAKKIFCVNVLKREDLQTLKKMNLPDF